MHGQQNIKKKPQS